MALPKYTTQKGSSSSSDQPAYSMVHQQEIGSENSLHSSTAKPSARHHHGLKHFGWWWEIGGIFFAILSTVAIIIILTKIDDQPISSWPYSIQPGTLVSIFSTIAKSALLVPVAVCISQLKWTYFEQPRDLSHMQVFDDASRGPLGALILLWKTRGVAWLAGVGALVTVLVMTYEPFSQQAIRIGEKVVLLKNETGAIWSKENFYDAPWGNGASEGSIVRFEFTIAMMEAMMPTKLESSIYGTSMYCGGEECRFPDFSTLSACTQCETEAVQINNEFGCKYYINTNSTNDGTSRKNYDKFDDFKSAVTGDAKSDLSSYGMDCAREKKGYPALNLNLEVNPNNKTWALLGLGRPKGSQPNSTALSHDAVFGSTFLRSNGSIISSAFVGSSFRYCSSGYNDGTQPEFDTIDAYTCFAAPMAPKLETLDTFGQFKGNLTHCRMSMCAQEYRDVSIYNNTLRSAPIVEQPLQIIGNGSTPTDLQVTTPDKKKTFQIGSKSIGYLTEMLETVLFSADYKEFLVQLTQKNEAGWEAVFERLAVVASSYIRRPEIQVVGKPLLGSVDGTAYGPQTYFKVTWLWLIMPFALVAACITFLIATVIHNHRKPYLFKHSVLAGMRFGVEGWQSGEKSTVKETHTDMARQAKGVRARLVSGQDGELRFVKE